MDKQSARLKAKQADLEAAAEKIEAGIAMLARVVDRYKDLYDWYENKGELAEIESVIREQVSELFRKSMRMHEQIRAALESEREEEARRKVEAQNRAKELAELEADNG